MTSSTSPEPGAQAAPTTQPSIPVEVLVGRWPEPGCVFRDIGQDGKPNQSLPEMVVIPAGTFTMGSPQREPTRDFNEDPQHEVTIARPFAMGRYTVTQSEWQAVMGNNPSEFEGDRNPVDSVNWGDVQAFVEALNKKLGRAEDNGYRLPSEAEWEYACRAGTTTPFWWGSRITTDVANFDGERPFNRGNKGTKRNRSVPVDEFEPNPFGLYQMHGNMDEWCEDCWHDDYAGAPGDGSAWTQEECIERVLRGGSWLFYAYALRSAHRTRAEPHYRSSNFGVRLVRDLALEA
ncbi:formylglycine-generating enzyme family protein [Hoeflea sp. TYP-13]|uniref:formylglycine-generating enzyme family protein n=1 Tax=Hoeflea sp. TYP-13 TaxID=3230023 RepID=UPI0034C64D73